MLLHISFAVTTVICQILSLYVSSYHLYDCAVTLDIALEEFCHVSKNQGMSFKLSASNKAMRYNFELQN